MIVLRRLYPIALAASLLFSGNPSHAGDVLLSAIQKASDNAAAASFPASMLSSAWATGNAAGEPYMWQTTGKPNKIVLYLHSWGGDYTQVSAPSIGNDLLTIQNAIIVSPNFGGVNNTPAALGSQDSTSRIAAVIQEIRYKTNLTRVYVVGPSGGGLAALLLIGRYPDLVYRASIWVPIYDLAALYGETSNATLKTDMVSAIGSAPVGDDARYLIRSPRSALQNFPGTNAKIIINVGSTDTEVPKHQGYDAVAAIKAASPKTDISIIEWNMGHEYHGLDAVKQLILE